MSHPEFIATYHLKANEDGDIVDADDEVFNADSYSRMKHGIVTDTRDFAKKLATTFCEEMPNIAYGEMPPAFVVAYESLPHAATVLTQFCLDLVNLERVQNGLAPGKVLRIHTKDYIDKYAHFSMDERERILASQIGIVASCNMQELQPVIIDDIRVTGSQERWFRHILATHTDRSIPSAYAASFTSAKSPELEGSLDDACIATLDDLLPYIENSDVVVTHKLARDLLVSTHDELLCFLDRLPPEMVELIAKGIAGMSSEILQPWQVNYQAILAK